MFTKTPPSGIVKLKQQNSEQKQRLLKWHILAIGHYFVATAYHPGQFIADKSLFFFFLSTVYLKDEYNLQNFSFPTQRLENLTFIFYQISSSLNKNKILLQENKIFTYVKSH